MVTRAAAAGHEVRALTRRAQGARANVDWIAGSLEKMDALERLVDGADAVIHVAGVVNAPNRAAFEAGNSIGTANLVTAMIHTGASRLIHVSSLAAREPRLSDYGWSKAQAERHIAASALDWTMVRPPAIYGPHDAELLELFQMASHGLVLLPPDGRLSVIHVDDLADLLVRLAGSQAAEPQEQAANRATYEVDDGRPDGWSHKELARAVGRAVGRKHVLPLALPALLLKLGARIDRLVRGDKARLTPDRANYFCHPDWVAQAELRPPASLWAPAIDTPAGLALTATAYRAKGLLR